MSVLAASDIRPTVAFPRTVAEAVSVLREYPGKAQVIAGGTWLMRAPVRGESLPAVLVSLERIDGIDAISRRHNGWTIGPMATHAALAAAFAEDNALRALAQAAGGSANPGVRRLATIGGNVATANFPAADLLPALLALDASLVISNGTSTVTVLVRDYLRDRETASGIISAIEIEDDGLHSAHARLTMRRAGEYPVANVSAAARIGPDGAVETIRIAAGSVEASARRWETLEGCLAGKPLSSAEAEVAARLCLPGFEPRAGVDAPSWYRLEVLPGLVRTALTDIESQTKG